jgi:hypothetical protein
MTFSRMSSRSVLVEERCGNHRLDDLLADVLAQRLGGDHARVLGGDDHGLHPHRHPSVVLDGDLALAVGPEVVDHAFPADLRETARELVGEHDGHGHQLVGLAAGVAEHQALVAGAPRVHSLGDVGRLLVDGRDHGAGLVVEAVLGPGVAHPLDGLANDPGQVGVGLGRDLPGDEREPGGHQRLAGHPAVGVFGQQDVEDGVGNLVRDLVGVPLGDGLRGEEVLSVLCHGSSRAPQAATGAEFTNVRV